MVKSEGLTRREFLRQAAGVGGGLAASLLLTGCGVNPEANRAAGVSMTEAIEANDPFSGWTNREKRGVEKHILIVAGGYDEKKNFAPFYLDALLWNHLAQTVWRVPTGNIKCLYFNGRKPKDENLIESYGRGGERDKLLKILSYPQLSDLKVSENINKTAVMEAIADLSGCGGEVYLITSTHGGMKAAYDESGKPIMTSNLLLPGGDLSDLEVTGLLETNAASRFSIFMMQCQAARFLNIPDKIANAVVMTADGADGSGESAWVDLSNSIEWPWSATLRQAIASSGSDLNADGNVSFFDAQSWVLNKDPMATQGWYHLSMDRQILTHPGLALGAMIQPASPLIVYG